MIYYSCKMLKEEITFGSFNTCLTLLNLFLSSLILLFNLTKLKYVFKFFNSFIDFFDNQAYSLCKAFDRDFLLVAPIGRKFCKAIFYFSFAV